MSARRAFIGLGSNLGEREANLAEARRRLAVRGYALERASSLFWTEPVGGPPQEWFLNQALLGTTALSPEELLRACLEIERELGRVRGVRFGPRVLDLDLLLYEDELRDGPGLELPHPRLHERRFVLVPLVELAPEQRHPRLRASLVELLARCPDRSAVERYSAVGAP